MASFLKKSGNMLKYVKTILTRVSFDALLFEKELRKAIKLLVKEEIEELKIWCYENFKVQHEAALVRCFS
jgi:hypothetical protein